MSVILYIYDEEGYYRGLEEARKSPLEPDTYLVPNGGTPIEPPQYDVSTHIPKFDKVEHKWTLVPLTVFDPTPEEVAAREAEQQAILEEEKAQRAAMMRMSGLILSDGIVNRHRDQLELVSMGVMGLKGTAHGKDKETNLTQQEYQDIILFRQRLREIDTDPTWPNVDWPTISVGGFTFPIPEEN